MEYFPAAAAPRATTYMNRRFSSWPRARALRRLLRTTLAQVFLTAVYATSATVPNLCHRVILIVYRRVRGVLARPPVSTYSDTRTTRTVPPSPTWGVFRSVSLPTVCSSNGTRFLAKCLSNTHTRTRQISRDTKSEIYVWKTRPMSSTSATCIFNDVCPYHANWFLL